MTYEDIEEGMVVICKKKQMMVTEVISKQALGKDPTMMKIKLVGTDAETGKPIKVAFRKMTTKIMVVSGFDSGSDSDDNEAAAAPAAGQDKETRTAADFDMASGDAGAAETVPIKAGELKKGSMCMLKGFPCKIIDISTSKTGKHGHAKANITGLDCFTGKKYNEVCPTSHNMNQPVLFRSEWMLSDIMDDTLSLMNEAGEMKEDLDLPRESTGELSKMSIQIKETFKTCPSSKMTHVVVLAAMGKEQVIDVMVKESK